MKNQKIKLQKIQEAEESRKKFENKKYENQELIDRIEGIANSILKETTSNKYRDHFFPLMISKLNLKTGVEIGVDLGLFSKHILEKTKIEKYYCVDTWQDDFGSNFKPGYYNKDGNVRFNKASETLKLYLGSFENPLAQNGRAVMLRMTGEEASKKLENNSLDFCYIDGDHSLFGIAIDLLLWTPKIKIGGIVGWHDHKDGPKSGIKDFWGEQLDYRVKMATEEYCYRFGHKLNVIGGRILNGYFIKNR